MRYVPAHYERYDPEKIREYCVSRFSASGVARQVMVSVTRVKISPDLSICTAHLSIFPSERGEEILSNIEQNNKSIRYALGQRMRNQLRIIPELRFFIDDSLDYIEHIDELLKK